MTTPAPTLSADLVLDSPACFREGDWWIWDYFAAGDARTVLGGTSQTTECFSTPWTSTVTYAGTGCPSRYTSACEDASLGVVTCCPSIYQFTCPTYTVNPDHHTDFFRCLSGYPTEITTEVTRVVIPNAGEVRTEIRTGHTFEHLFALAMMYTPLPPTSHSSIIPSPTSNDIPTSTSSPMATETPSKAATSGITVGTLVGVGFASAAFGIILVAFIWFVCRRRKAKAAAATTPAGPMAMAAAAPSPGAATPPIAEQHWRSVDSPEHSEQMGYTHGMETSHGSSQYNTSTPLEELPGEPSVYELDSDLRRLATPESRKMN